MESSPRSEEDSSGQPMSPELVTKRFHRNPYNTYLENAIRSLTAP
jgi:hypothetical protein